MNSDTKFRLVHALTSQSIADELEARLLGSSPADGAAAQALLDGFDSRLNSQISERLVIALTDSGFGEEIADKFNKLLDVLSAQANGSEVGATAATATLATTAPITLTSVATGTARNTNTFTLQVLAAAANPTNTVLAAFTGTAAAIVCTITPNDGTNNSATAVNLTTAQLVELINTGAVVGKSVTVTDASALRNDQTATGGGAQNLVDAGEGDGLVATFSGGTAASDADLAPAKAAFGSDLMSDGAFERCVDALTSRPAAEDFRASYNAMIGFVQAIS